MLDKYSPRASVECRRSVRVVGEQARHFQRRTGPIGPRMLIRDVARVSRVPVAKTPVTNQTRCLFDSPLVVGAARAWLVVAQDRPGIDRAIVEGNLVDRAVENLTTQERADFHGRRHLVQPHVGAALCDDLAIDRETQCRAVPGPDQVDGLARRAGMLDRNKLDDKTRAEAGMRRRRKTESKPTLVTGEP
jgi:hypothetical protein